MSELAKKSRAAMKDKAKRRAEATSGKVDASSFTPETPMASGQTGKRPTGRQGFKDGGKVGGEHTTQRADRQVRVGPKRPGKQIGGSLAMLSPALMAANAIRDDKDDGKKGPGLKRGGRAAKADGGAQSAADKMVADAEKRSREDFANLSKARNRTGDFNNNGRVNERGRAAPLPTPREVSEAVRVGPGGIDNRVRLPGYKTGGRAAKAGGGNAGDTVPTSRMAFAGTGGSRLSKSLGLKGGGSVSDGTVQGTRPTGGRKARKDGGRASKGVNVNIVIAPGKGQDGPPIPPGLALPKPPPPMPPMPPPGMGPQGPGGPPPMMGGPPPGMPPMPRKRGGRAMANKDAGAGSGMGRLEKAGLA